MDPAAQQQEDGNGAADADGATDADRAALRAEAQECYFKLVRTTRCFDMFCNDMQVAINELSQYNVARYLDVTLKSDYLKDRMRQTTNLTTSFFSRWLDHPSPSITRCHINQITLLLLEVRDQRNRIAELYLERMVWDIPDAYQLAKNLDRHLTLLQEDVHRIFIFAARQAHMTESDFEAVGLIPMQSSPAPQEG